MNSFVATTHEAATIARAGIGGTIAIVRRLKGASADWHSPFVDEGRVLFRSGRYTEDLRYLPLSPGKPVWVKEGWSKDGDCPLQFKAGPHVADDALGVSWRPPITMPRWASRFTLTPETVRVCRLSEVTDDELNSTANAPHPLKDAPADTWVMVALCKIGGVE